jgi:glycolate oxidase FAD binding subunit
MVSAATASREELDAETRVALVVDDVQPRWRAQPTSQTQLAETLREAAEHDLVVAPRGGGTRLGLGNPPAQLDLVVETGGLKQVVEYEPADLTITVEAGMPLAELQALLGAQGQHLALDPPAAPG